MSVGKEGITFVYGGGFPQIINERIMVDKRGVIKPEYILIDREDDQLVFCEFPSKVEFVKCVAISVGPRR